MNFVLTLLEAEAHRELPIPAWGFGIIAFAVFVALAFVTLSYRNVANRHSHKAEAYARAHANDVQQAGHGH